MFWMKTCQGGQRPAASGCAAGLPSGLWTSCSRAADHCCPMQLFQQGKVSKLYTLVQIGEYYLMLHPGLR